MVIPNISATRSGWQDRPCLDLGRDRAGNADQRVTRLIELRRVIVGHPDLRVESERGVGEQVSHDGGVLLAQGGLHRPADA
ncbi:MAG: hypothetical protein M3228_02555 [Actinomycetota bacterium]|nr:hypothetical protein [Actinomycetota bacterium]